MTYRLSPEEYENTKEKREFLRARLALLRERTDLVPTLKEQGIRSYESMLKQLTEEMLLYEARRAELGIAFPPSHTTDEAAPGLDSIRDRPTPSR